MSENSNIVIDTDLIISTILDDTRYSFEKIDYNDENVWDLICSGFTKGLFQIDKGLGQRWSKEVKPREVSEGSDLIALIRPGCMDAKMEDGKSLTEHYVMRKHGKEYPEYLIPQLESMVGKTYGILVYQEQAIKIAMNLAGYSEVEADILRKSLGKKDSELMNSLKASFIEGCEKHSNIPKENAAEIFGWIQAGQRYSFNASHALAYFKICYATAYEKYYHTDKFFSSWLRFAFGKPDAHDEIKQLCSESRRYGYKLATPHKDNYCYDFETKDKQIHFGIKNIKNVTKKGLEAISQLDLSKEWDELLLDLWNVDKKTLESLIYIGFFGEQRQLKLFQIKKLKSITKAEYAKVVESGINSFIGAIEYLAENASAKKKTQWKEHFESLKEPPSELYDSNPWIVGVETELLGVPISASLLDDIENHSRNCTCEEFKSKNLKEFSLNVIVDSYYSFKTKTGNNIGSTMARAELSDETGMVNAIIFPEDWEVIQHYFYDGATLLVKGFRSKKDGGLIIKKAKEI